MNSRREKPGLARLHRFFSSGWSQVPFRIRNAHWSIKILLACSALTAWQMTAHISADEVGQITRFYAFKLGWPGTTPMPWEFHEMIRPWFQPMVYLPFAWAYTMLAGIKPMQVERVVHLLNLILLLVAIIYSGRLLRSLQRDGGPSAWVFAAMLWFIPSVYLRHSSEAFSTCLLCLRFYHWHKSHEEKSGGGFITGILLGLAFLARYQVALIIAPAWVYLAISNHSYKKLLPWFIALGISCAIAFGVVIDYIGYGKLTFSAWGYFNQNLVQNKAASFGTEPWYWYFRQVLQFTANPWLLLFIIVAPALARTTFTRAIAWGGLTFFIVHCALGHKELRFLFPLLPVIAIISVETFSRQWQGSITRWIFHPKLISAVVILNATVMVLFTLFGPYKSKRWMGNYLLENLEPGSTVFLSESMYNIYHDSFSKDTRQPALAHGGKVHNWNDVFLPPGIRLVFTVPADFRKACSTDRSAFVYTTLVDKKKGQNVSFVDRKFTRPVFSQYPGSAMFSVYSWLKIRRFKIIRCETIIDETTPREMQEYRYHLYGKP